MAETFPEDAFLENSGSQQYEETDHFEEPVAGDLQYIYIYIYLFHFSYDKFYLLIE